MIAAECAHRASEDYAGAIMMVAFFVFMSILVYVMAKHG